METTIKKSLRNHLTLNACQNVYSHLPADFEKRNGKYGLFIKFDEIKEYQIEEAIKNLEIIDARKVSRAAIIEIAVGDYLKRSDGSMSRVTYVYDNSVQDGGGSGSFHMFRGGRSSYSGGLEPGINKDKVKLTKEKKEGLFWLFSNDWSGAYRGVDFYCEVNVWEEI